MFLNNILKFLVLISTLGFIFPSNAQLRNSAYNTMINTSQKVVVGKIKSREELRFDYEGENLVCGHILEIEVSESWKGGAESFKVFASNSDILMENDGGETEYFLFARKNPNFLKTGREALAFTNCDEGRSARLDTSELEYLATRLRQQIFPLVTYDGGKVIDEDTGVMKRGRWMMIVNRIANSALPYTIARRRLNNGNENIIEEMNLDHFIEEIINN